MRPSVVRYSRRAEQDLLDIGRYTLETWGVEQADRYLAAVEDFCQRIAESPLIGKSCAQIHPGLRRMPHGKHMAYYCQTADGISVSRILHQSMLPGRDRLEEAL